MSFGITYPYNDKGHHAIKMSLSTWFFRPGEVEYWSPSTHFCEATSSITAIENFLCLSLSLPGSKEYGP